MRPEIALLIVLMALVTYAGRSLPLLMPGVGRRALAMRHYTRLVAPATLAALAATTTLLATSGGSTDLVLGPLVPAGTAALFIAAWRRSLPLTIAGAVVVAALWRRLI